MDMLPWWLKAALKLALSRLPLPQSVWRRLGIYKLGAMTDPNYALSVFLNHFKHFTASSRKSNFVALELGPGDSLLSALIAHSFGAARSYLLDVGPLASDDIKPFQELQQKLQSEGHKAPRLDGCSSIEEVLRVCSAEYLTSGLASLRAVPDHSVDLMWSTAVLEHVSLAEFSDTLVEMYRILAPGGISSHTIDLKDHLGGALNSLRFPAWLWESNLFQTSGFYSNRLRFSELCELFEQAGFSYDVVSKRQWAALPTPRNKLHRAFKDLADQDLMVSGFDVVLRPT